MLPHWHMEWQSQTTEAENRRGFYHFFPFLFFSSSFSQSLPICVTDTFKRSFNKPSHSGENISYSFIRKKKLGIFIVNESWRLLTKTSSTNRNNNPHVTSPGGDKEGRGQSRAGKEPRNVSGDHMTSEDFYPDTAVRLGRYPRRRGKSQGFQHPRR